MISLQANASLLRQRMIDEMRMRQLSPKTQSIGAMMYQLLTGPLPFGSDLRAVRNIMDGAVPAFSRIYDGEPAVLLARGRAD